MKNNLILPAGEIFYNVYTGPAVAPNWYKDKYTFNLDPPLGTTLDTGLVETVYQLDETSTDEVLAISLHSNSGADKKDLDVANGSFTIDIVATNNTQKVIINLPPTPPAPEPYIDMNFDLDCVCYEPKDETTIMAFKGDVVQFFTNEILVRTDSRLAMFPEIGTNTVSSVYRNSVAGTNPNTFWQLYFYDNAGTYWKYEANTANPTIYTFVATGSHPWMVDVGPRGEGWKLWFKNDNGIMKVDVNGNTGIYEPYGAGTLIYPTLPNTKIPDSCWNNTTTGLVYVSIVDTIYILDTSNNTVISYAKYNQPIPIVVEEEPVVAPIITSTEDEPTGVIGALQLNQKVYNLDYPFVKIYLEGVSAPNIFDTTGWEHNGGATEDVESNTRRPIQNRVCLGIFPVLEGFVGTGGLIDTDRWIYIASPLPSLSEFGVSSKDNCYRLKYFNI